MSRNIRSGQLLTPFGIGQIVNFPNEESLMICGLDKWDQRIYDKVQQAGQDSIDLAEFTITEPRLQKLLNVDHFKKPFPFRKKGNVNKELSIPAVRFPGWHYCSHCEIMRFINLLQTDIPACTSVTKGKNCRGKMIPVRFVAACHHGHIQDVPFREWVHNGPVISETSDHILKFRTGMGSGDLGSIIISCSCGTSKSLAGLLNVRKDGDIVFDSALARIGLDGKEENEFSRDQPNNSNSSGQYCKGYRPWLGQEGINNAVICNAHLQVLIRGGSNIHYSHTSSAIYLPESDSHTHPIAGKVIERVGIKQLRLFFELDNTGDILGSILRSYPEVSDYQISEGELLTQIIDVLKKDDTPSDDAIYDDLELRWQEYCYINKGRDSEFAEFKAIRKTFENYIYKDFLEDNFECVVLIEKLKETRVFKGFSRIIATARNEDDLKNELSNCEVTWLPAYEVFGEGIFLKFKDHKIDSWLKNQSNSSINQISKYRSAMSLRNSDKQNRDINPAFIMMHTFAHLLIKRLCFGCGYGSSSLRERIYFSTEEEKRMNGILIYTASGDSEGSMGGLVRQGKENFLGRIISEAVEEGKWCSADPVCSDIGQKEGQGPDNVNGSACHNCCILPETSCEEFNVLLDRYTISGSVSDPSKGFFSYNEEC